MLKIWIATQQISKTDRAQPKHTHWQILDATTSGHLRAPPRTLFDFRALPCTSVEPPWSPPGALKISLLGLICPQNGPFGLCTSVHFRGGSGDLRAPPGGVCNFRALPGGSSLPTFDPNLGLSGPPCVKAGNFVKSVHLWKDQSANEKTCRKLDNLGKPQESMAPLLCVPGFLNLFLCANVKVPGAPSAPSVGGTSATRALATRALAAVRALAA